MMNIFQKLHSSQSKCIIKNDGSQFDLNHLFNQLSMYTLNPPDFQKFRKQKEQNLISIPIPSSFCIKDDQKQESKQNLVQVLSDVKGLKNILRYIKLQTRHQNKFTNKQTQQKFSNSLPVQKYIFIRPTQALLHGDKAFWMRKGIRQHTKVKLNLDSPTFVITFNIVSPITKQGENLLVAIERKCITLYQIDQGKINLKDFDSVSISKKLNLVQLKYLHYQNKNYVLLFGNEKQGKVNYFKCLIYEIQNMNLIFVKKANISENQIYSPAIFFQNYPKNQNEKYCLIVGGCYDDRNSFYYQALQVDLHLLITSWLNYPLELTRIINFDSKKNNILSGKALKYNDYWYIFCTENQTLNQLKLSYKHGIQIERIQISTVDLELKEKIYFSQNNLFLILKGTLKILMLNKNLQLREKDFLQIVQRFENY